MFKVFNQEQVKHRIYIRVKLSKKLIWIDLENSNITLKIKIYIQYQNP